jgi:hypothetical protein
MSQIGAALGGSSIGRTTDVLHGVDQSDNVATGRSDPRGAARDIEVGRSYALRAGLDSSWRENRVWHPDLDLIWNAAERNGLPIEFPFVSTAGSNWLTPVGWPACYLEAHSSAAQHQRSLTWQASLIFSGLFERFPKLKMLWVEAGYTWVLPVPLIALLIFVRRRPVMGDLVNRPLTTVLAVLCTAAIIVLNVLFVLGSLGVRPPLIGN